MERVTPLVFVPGMMCDARLFMPQIIAFGGHRAVHIAPITAHETVQALATEILANAPPVFALVGLSMGGIVAMEILAQAHDRVERVALLDTNPRAELSAVAAKRGPQIDAVKAGHLQEVMQKQMIPHYLAQENPELITLCWDMARGLGADVFIRQSRALRDRPDQQKTLAKYHGPALVLCGEHDKLCPQERHEAMHALLPNSTYEVIKNAGHLPTIEQPQHTTAALARWLEAS